MRFSQLVERIGGEGASAWLTHYEAVAARERGEDVIILSVGDPDLATPAAVIARAIEQLHAGDTHYVPAAGRLTVRQAIARAHAARSGQQVEADNVIYLAGAQNALFVASPCLAGPGGEVGALGGGAGEPRPASGPHVPRRTRHAPHAHDSLGEPEQSERRGVERARAGGDRRSRAAARPVAGGGRGLCRS